MAEPGLHSGSTWPSGCFTTLGSPVGKGGQTGIGTVTGPLLHHSSGRRLIAQAMGGVGEDTRLPRGLTLSNCVTLGKSFNPSASVFFYVRWEDQWSLTSQVCCEYKRKQCPYNTYSNTATMKRAGKCELLLQLLLFHMVVRRTKQACTEETAEL